MKKRLYPTPSEPMTIEPEEPTPTEQQLVQLVVSRWPTPYEPLTKTMADNINRMKTDPAFRDEIAKKIF
jgi:hypothetical protein